MNNINEEEAERIGRAWARENGKEPDNNNWTFERFGGVQICPFDLPQHIYLAMDKTSTATWKFFNSESTAYIALGRALVASGTVEKEKPKMYRCQCGFCWCSTPVPGSECQQCKSGITIEDVHPEGHYVGVTQEKPKQEPVNWTPEQRKIYTLSKQVHEYKSSAEELEEECEDLAAVILSLQAENDKLLTIISQAKALAERWEKERLHDNNNEFIVHECAAELRVVLEDKNGQ